MENKFEIIISLLLAILLILFINPFSFLMLSSINMMILTGIILLTVLFAGIIWKEKAKDEREMVHNMKSGRLGYLAGFSALLIGVIYQSFIEHVDPDFWLVFALLVMVLAKLVGHIYSGYRG